MMLSLRFKADDVFKPFDQLLKDDAYWKGYRDTLAKGLTPLFTEIFVAGVQAGAGAKLRKHKAQPDRPADAPVPTAEELASISEKAIRDYVNTFTKGISDTTYDRVRTAVIGARQSGGGVEEVLTKIAPMFDAKRAESIAVTETTRLFGMGSQAMYRARGVTGWEWETANDPWVDKQECVQLQGKQFPIAVDFQPAHPRCRCWPAPVMLPEDMLTPETWASGLSDEQKATIAAYSDDLYAPINQALRAGKSWRDPDQIADLDNAIRSYSSSEDQVVYRGMTTNPQSLRLGVRVEDKGFISTTADREVAEQYTVGRSSEGVLFELRLPKGTRMAPIGEVAGLSEYSLEEKEVILARDSSFVVTKIRTEQVGSNTRKVVTLSTEWEELP